MAPAVVEKTAFSDSDNREPENNLTYLAKPAGDCCLKGSIHEGEPRGSYAMIAGVETYVVAPPSGRANNRILLYFPDVWGLFNNGLLIMDGFADAGYLTLGLDYFRGVGRLMAIYMRQGLNLSIRIRCGSTEQVDTTKLILTLTMRLGNASTWPLQTKLYQDGSRRQKRSMANRKQNTLALGKFITYLRAY
jgi:hypothetical protein